MKLRAVTDIAGTAASIIGRRQNVVGAGTAIVSRAIYAGTIHNLTNGVGLSGTAAFALFVMESLKPKRQRAGLTK